MTERTTFRPDWAVHPGETIAEAIAEQGITRTAFAQKMGIPQSQLTSLIKGRRGIGPGMALRLEHATGTDAVFWIHLQGQYDVAIERKRQAEPLPR